MIYYLILLLYSINSWAENQWDQVRSEGLVANKEYNISSGTGFFITNDLLITNYHVVESCQKIAIRGAVAASIAKLVAINSSQDLALLSSAIKVNQPAIFVANDTVEQVNNKQLFIAGYPLKHSENGNYLLSPARIDQIDQNNQIEFDATVERGNSGGPLLDKYGNVFGIVQAKKNYYYIDDQQPFKTSGLAIGLPIIKDFLASYFVNYQIDNNWQNQKQDPNLRLKDYLVNIHCIQ